MPSCMLPEPSGCGNVRRPCDYWCPLSGACNCNGTSTFRSALCGCCSVSPQHYCWSFLLCLFPVQSSTASGLALIGLVAVTAMCLVQNHDIPNNNMAWQTALWDGRFIGNPTSAPDLYHLLRMLLVGILQAPST